MVRSVVAVGVLLVLAACAEDPPAPQPAPVEPPPETAPPAPVPTPAPAKQTEPDKPRRETFAERAHRANALEKRVTALRAAHALMLTRQGNERADLPKIDTPVRRRYVQLMIDARRAQHSYTWMQARLVALQVVADSAVTVELKELRASRKGIVKRQDAIQNAWEAALEDMRLGRVSDSPVKKDLDLVRAIKKQWFLESSPARRGIATSRERRKINDRFRAWLGGEPARREVATAVLAQPGGPGGAPDRYDFTQLDFFILLELLEDDLDRKNIAVEKKELVENRAKLDAIRIELDGIDERISAQLEKGGDELSEYEDLVRRRPDARSKAEYLATEVAEWAVIFKEVAAIVARHMEEEEELIAELQKARVELARLR